MRGSVYYQTSQLIKIIFNKGSKKTDRIDEEHEEYKSISSYKTMETYRSVWNNFFNYLKEYWKIKNCELIKEEHVYAYFAYKIEYYPSYQYAQKIVSALLKLEFVLNKYSREKYSKPIIYDFSNLLTYLSNSKKTELVYFNNDSRAFINPLKIIENLKYPNHKLAARIQLQSGARSEAVTLINIDQLKGSKIDEITKEERGIITTKEKGGKVGDVFVNMSTYKELEFYFRDKGIKSFRIKYQKYATDIRNACILSGENTNGSHSFRWVFAKKRVQSYQDHGYSYEEALQGVSWEMKHFRANITEHYLK